MAAMRRSQFEKLIDAGLASQRPAPLPCAAQVAINSVLYFGAQLGGDPAAASRSRPHLSARDLRRAYRDWTDSGKPEPEPLKPQAPRPEPALSHLIAQLNDRENLTRAQLQGLRRQLARRLHPDLMSPDDRQSATAEMAKLNAMIDTALRACRR